MHRFAWLVSLLTSRSRAGKSRPALLPMFFAGVVLPLVACQPTPASSPPGPSTAVAAPPVAPTVAPSTVAPRPTATQPGSSPADSAPLSLEEKVLRVPAALRTGVFSQERRLNLPKGFDISIFAAGLGSPRFMAMSPSNDLFVSIPQRGQVAVLPDKNRDGVADETLVFAQGLNLPHGLAFYKGFLYVAETGSVVRFRYNDGDLRASGPKETIVPNLPAGGGHWTRTIVFGPDDKMYVSIGSSCNVCEERDERRAAILQFNPDGSEGRIFARGLRNAVGIVFRPGSSELWATVNGRDNLGDDLPPELITAVKDGGHYGWPYCYGNQVPDPQFGRSDFCTTTELPTFGVQAHSAPLGLRFYTGQQFPADYRGDLFVAYHGSWNRSVPTGYKVVKIKMSGGKPERVEDFLTGFLSSRGVWGRPVDVLAAPDGSLLVSDDQAGAIYRITYAQGG